MRRRNQTDDSSWIVWLVVGVAVIGGVVYAASAASASSATKPKFVTATLAAGQTQTLALSVGDSVTVLSPTAATQPSVGGAGEGLLQMTSSDSSIGVATYLAKDKGSVVITAGDATLNITVS